MKKQFTLILSLLITTLLYAQEKQPLLSVPQMHSDIAVLKCAFTQLHPGIYRYTTKARFNQYFDDITRQTAKPLRLAGFYTRLSQLTAKLKCGHTYLNPYNQRESVNVQLLSVPVLPLLFKVIDKRLIVTHNLSGRAEIKPGDELVSINGMARSAIIDSLLTVSRADGDHGLDKRLDNISITPEFANGQKYALFDIYFPLFFPHKDKEASYQMLVKSYKTKTLITYPIDLISKTERDKRYQHQFGSGARQATATFKWISARCGYLQIRDFTTEGWGGDYQIILDSVFTELHALNAQHLIVDIRDNEGGDDAVRNKVISYLIKQPAFHAIRRYYRFLKVPDELLPYIKTWDPSFKAPKPADEYAHTTDNLYFEKNRNPVDIVIPNQKHFSGKVYLMTNATNSSSSFLMADILQQTKSVKLVGEPTGGTKQGINGGQFFFLYLPSSGIEVDIPLVYQSPLKMRKDEGIQPDVTVTTQPEDMATGLDRQLEYLIRRISR